MPLSAIYFIDDTHLQLVFSIWFTAETLATDDGPMHYAIVMDAVDIYIAAIPAGGGSC